MRANKPLPAQMVKRDVVMSVVLNNVCAFIKSAMQESITAPVVATGDA